MLQQSSSTLPKASTTDLAAYRASKSEIDRIGDLMAMLPESIGSALDIGARDGFISKLLADRIANVTALDLDLPVIADPRIQCLRGDITELTIADNSFDLVFCAEVLEHIPTQLLGTAAKELGRVAHQYLLIGVPYRQDIRVGRTTCQHCGKISPPYGHVNRFDENALKVLFPDFVTIRSSYVGQNNACTNFMSSALMDWAGNPFGTYSQDEPCIHCGAQLTMPRQRKFWQKICTKIAHWGNVAQQQFNSPHANWIHILLKK